MKEFVFSDFSLCELSDDASNKLSFMMAFLWYFKTHYKWRDIL